MKKTIALVFGVSIVAGVTYTIWAYGGVGKSMLAKWLLRQWKLQAARKGKTLDLKKLEKELAKLSYEDHELLFRYTLIDPIGKPALDAKAKKRADRLIIKMSQTGLAERADLLQLSGIILP